MNLGMQFTVGGVNDSSDTTEAGTVKKQTVRFKYTSPPLPAGMRLNGSLDFTITISDETKIGTWKLGDVVTLAQAVGSAS